MLPPVLVVLLISPGLVVRPDGAVEGEASVFSDRLSSPMGWDESSGELPALVGWRGSTSICPLSSSTMPSSLRSRFISSTSRSLVCFGGALGSFGRGRLGARPGAGKMQEMCALRQLPHGMCLSQRTLRRRQVTHLSRQSIALVRCRVHCK